MIKIQIRVPFPWKDFNLFEKIHEPTVGLRQNTFYNVGEEGGWVG